MSSIFAKHGRSVKHRIGLVNMCTRWGLVQREAACNTPHNMMIDGWRGGGGRATLGMLQCCAASGVHRQVRIPLRMICASRTRPGEALAMSPGDAIGHDLGLYRHGKGSGATSDFGACRPYE